MAWFGEGLSSLKGQITSFTKEVLSEGRDEIYVDASSELSASKKKLEDLEALCAAQDLEISELRQRNAELQRRLGAGDADHTDDALRSLEKLHRQDDLENAKQELAEKTYLVESLKQQLENLTAEKQDVNARCVQLEEQMQQREAEQPRGQTEDSSGSLKEQLRVAEKRVEELERELQRVQQQMLEQLSDSQLNTSEIRSEVEQTRWQLLQESGAQKTELLRARQDMVNRIIQMGEKSREVEMNMKKLQMEGKHVTADILAVIHKLGDPEQQELIHGALKTLELENQVLKLRNAQLELAGSTETIKGTRSEFEKKSEDSDVNTKYLDAGSGKSYDDDATSLRSEVSGLSHLKHKLEEQVAGLEAQVEKYERDMECFEMLKSDWAEEKQSLQERLSDLKQQLKEKEEKLSLVTAQKGLKDMRNQMPDETSSLEKKVEDLSVQLSRVQEEKEQLQVGKVCMSSELEAMAKIVQDLETQLAKLQEENATLTQSLEDLDEQHQGALDQLLQVKQGLQKQNEKLESEVKSLRSEETELHNKISKLITFEIPQSYYSNNNNDASLRSTVEALAKMSVECKWQRDTLERKVAELMKELRDTKHKLEERDGAAQKLESDCKLLKENCEMLMAELTVSRSGGGEGLAPIPENSEEAETRIASLESEVEVLREARSNLEADAKKLREEEQVMVRRLESATAALRNQENLTTELCRWQEEANEAKAKLEEVMDSRQALEEDVDKLKQELQDSKSAYNELKQLQEGASQEQSKLQEERNLRLTLEEEMVKVRQELLVLQAVPDELGKWQEAAAQTQEKIQEEKNLRENLEAEVMKLRQELDKHRKAAATAEAKLQEAVSFNKSLEEEKETLRQRHENLASELQEKLKLQGNLQTRIAELEEQLRQEQQAKESTTLEVKDLQGKMEELEKGYAEEQQSQIAELQNSLQAEVTRLQHLLQKEQEARRSVEVACQNSHASKQELAALQQQLEGVEAARNSMLEECHESHMSRDILGDEGELKSALAEKSMQLEETLEKIDNLHLELNTQIQSVQVLTAKLEDTEAQLLSALQAKTQMEKDLFSTQRILKRKEEEIEELIRTNEELPNEMVKQFAENQNSYKLLEAELSRKEEEVENLEREKQELQEKLDEMAQMQDQDQEIRKWKEMAQASERQLNEVLQVRAELEMECGRLYAIETKVQNQEHSERELLRWKETAEELEDKCSQLMSEKAEVEQRCKDVTSQIGELREAEKDAVERALRLEGQLGQALQSNSALESRCQELLAVEEKLRGLEQESGRWKEQVLRLQQELNEVMETKAGLEAECKRLLAVEGKLRQQESLEAEVVELRAQLGAAQKEPQPSSTDEQVQTLQAERQRILSVLDEKTRENGLLRAENSRLLEAVTQHKLAVDKLEQERQFQGSEAAQMAKETIANLSQMIKDRDMEIEALKQKSETLVNLLQESPGKTDESTDKKQGGDVDVLRQELEQVSKERAELITAVQVKHNESLQYHAEIQRLTKLLSEAQASSGSPVSFQKVDTEQMPEELRQLQDSLLQEQTRNKYLQNEVQEQYEKESALIRELERLRQHLVEVEESYTQETLRAEEQARDLRNKLAQAEERIKNSSTAYTSASIRANQHVESLQGQARLIAQQRDELQQKLSATEDQVQHHTAALRNLQIVLEQFQKDKEREISAATEKVRQQLVGAQRRHEELQAEIATLQVQLSDAKEGLSAAARLGEQLDKKSETITSLKEEVTKLTNQLQEAESRVQSASLNVEGKVDRYLVKNLVLGYFMAPANTRSQVLRIVATVLDFNQEERDRVGVDSAASSSSGWFKSLMQPGKGPPNMQSLSEAFVRFLENESRPQPQLRLLPEGQESTQGSSRSESPSSSTAGSQRRSPLLLADVQLPTFTQFPVGRNSSSILKDVLKDS